MAQKITPDRASLLRALDPFLERATKLTTKLQQISEADDAAYLAMVAERNDITGRGWQSPVPESRLDDTTRALLTEARHTFERTQAKVLEPLDAAIHTNSDERTALLDLRFAIDKATAFRDGGDPSLAYYLLYQLRTARAGLDKIRDPDLRTWPLFADFGPFEAALAAYVTENMIELVRHPKSGFAPHDHFNGFQFALSVAAASADSTFDAFDATRRAVAAIATHGAAEVAKVLTSANGMRVEDLRRLAIEAPTASERETAAELARLFDEQRREEAARESQEHAAAPTDESKPDHPQRRRPRILAPPR
jgi:hypothetical protein